MKKKLLALAVAGAFVAPVAMADTTIYGVANMSYDMTNTGTTSGSESQTKVSSNSSRIGFKGSEDLGGGTNAIYQIESQIGMDGTGNTTAACTALPCAATTSNNNTLGTRNTFVGLSGESWGTVLLGRNDTPYKASTRRLDLFADGIADNRTLMGRGIFGFDGRNADVVQYDSPSMSGFKASAQYTAGAETATTAGWIKGNAVSLAGMYDAGPIYATLAYQTNKFGTAGSGTLGVGTADKSERAWKVGGSYTMDQFQVNAVYESTKDDTGAAGADVGGHKAYYLGGKFNVSSSDAVKLAYTKAKEIQGGNTVNSGAKQVSLGYDHAMSKRTTVYALYTKLSNDLVANYALSNAAAVSTGALTAQGADSDPHAFSLGLKHTF